MTIGVDPYKRINIGRIIYLQKCKLSTVTTVHTTVATTLKNFTENKWMIINYTNFQLYHINLFEHNDRTVVEHGHENWARKCEKKSTWIELICPHIAAYTYFILVICLL